MPEGATNHFDVLVVGGSAVGATFALALADAALTVGVVEAQPPRQNIGETWDTRVYAISPGSVEFLGKCGIWQHLDHARINRVEDMRVFGDDGRSEVNFSAYDAGLRELAFIVENGQLQRQSWHAMQHANHISVFAPALCVSLTFTDDTAHVTLADGRALTARMVVGADGSDSWVRAQLGIRTSTQPYYQAGVVANFSCGKPHRDTAFQWFRKDGVLALLPLPDNRVSMVWSTPEDRAESLSSLTNVELAGIVASSSEGILGHMEVISACAAFPLRLQRVRELVRARAALLGDAAHSVHPLAGQGINIGFRDARELAQVLKTRGAMDDCGDYYLLRRYERARREDILKMQIVTDTLQKLFDQDAKWLANARNFGLRLVNRQALLKNLLVQQAVA